MFNVNIQKIITEAHSGVSTWGSDIKGLVCWSRIQHSQRWMKAIGRKTGHDILYRLAYRDFPFQLTARQKKAMKLKWDLLKREFDGII